MRSSAGTALTGEALLPHVLRKLTATAAALITREGDLRDANAGFLRIAGSSVAGDVRDLFVNPRFDQFAARTADPPDGALYRGILNIGDMRSEVHSLRGAVYAADRYLLVIGEPDVGALQEELDALRTMNEELAQALRGGGRPPAVLESIERLRQVLGRAGVIAAEADAQLRYRCITSPHAGFEPSSVVGKRDDEIEDSEGARALTALKETVLRTGRGAREAIGFQRSDGLKIYDVQVDPLHDAAGVVVGVTSVTLDVTAWARAQQELREADRYKDEFLATLAHELRNPLAPIRTGLDLIQALNGDGGACKQPLQMMNRQLAHLVRLVDDLLDVSRIGRGKIELRKERLDLAEIIDAALEMSESRIGRGDRRLTVRIPSEPLAVEGDRVRLVQVVANLLNNAAKFTDDGGRIELRVVPRGDRVEIRVQDDGRGIPRERLDEIFELFSQVEPGCAGGLGIGLTLARSLVAMHGGTISAESEGLGRGATFTVSLPLCPSIPQPVPHEAAETGPVPPRRVLVVAGNRDIAESLRLLLTTLKAEVRIAHDGAEAIRIICEDWPPTHVLADLGTSGIDGFEVVRRLRAAHPERAFRLVAISGRDREEDRERTWGAGFDQHLVKPVGAAELKAVLAD